jgi:hypothetical protein
LCGVLLQALLAFLQQHAALLDGFFRRLQRWRSFRAERRRWPAGDRGRRRPVQGARCATGRLRLQLLAFVLQCLLRWLLALSSLASCTPWVRNPAGAGRCRRRGAGLFQRGFHMLLPGFGAGLFAEQLAERRLGLLALFVQCGDFLQQCC